MFDAVLFDIGDTLVHFETYRTRKYAQDGARLAHTCLAQVGHRPPPWRWYYRRVRWAFLADYLRSRLRGREVRLEELVRRTHRRMGIDLSDAQTRDLLLACTPAIQPLYVPDEHALPVVRQLQDAGIRLGIVSNTFFPGHAVDGVLDALGLLRFFEVRVYSSDCGVRKPHPAIFRTALDRMQVDAAKSLYVGDHPRKDMFGAARVGMTPVLMAKTGRFSTRRGRAVFVIHELTELLPICSRPTAYDSLHRATAGE